MSNKGQPRSVIVDHFGVVCVQGGKGHGDVFLRDAKFQPEISECFRLSAPLPQPRQGWKSRVVPSAVGACFNVSPHLRGGKSTPFVHLDTTPVHGFGIGPAEVLVQQRLLSS